MRLPKLPPLDLFSFWVGFAVAGGLAFLLFLLRKPLARIQEDLTDRWHKLRESLTSGAERSLREDLLKQAQGMHLAGQLFPLDQVLLPPRFLIPDPGFDPTVAPPDEDLTTIIPLIPEWPDLAALYQAPSIDVPTTFKGDSSVVVLAGPGCGKTTLLAHLASRAAAGDTALFPTNPTPVLVHVADLNLPVAEGDDVAQPLVDAAQARASLIAGRQLPKHLFSRLREGKCLLFLDGFDELPIKQTLEITGWLETFQKAYGGNRLIAAAGLWGHGPLVKLGLAPVHLAPWGPEDYRTLIKKWGTLLEKHLQRKNDPATVDPLVVMGWIGNGNFGRSIFEVTLKIWSAFVGDVRGNRPVDWLEAYLLRCNVGVKAVTTTALGKLAAAMLVNEDFLGGQRAGLATICDTGLVGPSGKAEMDSDDFLDDLTKHKVLIKRAQDRLSFVYPLAGAYSAALALVADPGAAPVQITPLWARALYFFAPLGDLTPIVARSLHQPPDVLYTDLFTCALWLRDAAPSSRWRSEIFRRLSQLMVHKDSPESLRVRALAGLAASNDANVIALFKQVLGSPDPFSRRLAALGLGTFADTTLVPALTPLFNDPYLDVRWAAALALAAIGSEASLNALAEALKEGDDEVRRASAMALARNSEVGHAALTEAIANENLSMRRAAVYGLAATRAEWAYKIVENVQINEQQWIVRNAAVEMMALIKEPPDLSPKPYPAPDALGWLVSWAASQGTGVPPGKAAIDVLNKALSSGDEVNRRAAAGALGRLCDPGAARELYAALRAPEPLVRDAAFRALAQTSMAANQRLAAPV